MKERKITTDMWFYELPLNSLTERDCKRANDFNLSWQHNYLEECDFLFGTWHSIIAYLKDYIGVEWIAEYMHPIHTVVKEEEDEQ